LRTNAVAPEDTDYCDQYPSQLADTVLGHNLIQDSFGGVAASRGCRGHQHQHTVRIGKSLDCCGDMRPAVMQRQTGIDQPDLVTLREPQTEFPAGVVVELWCAEHVLAECGKEQRHHRGRANTA
jgi:hypothetical protein